jgi:hypothetical protein
METMTVSFVPDLPDPPIHNPADYNVSVCWADIKSVLMYRAADNRVRVVACKTEEEFQAESLTATFHGDYTLIDSWTFE